MKIVVLDGYTENPGDLSWERIACQGEFTVYDRTSANQIVSRIGNAEIVFTNKTPITEETMHLCGNIKYIGVLATGYNVVDVKAAAKRGIVVTNIPAYGTNAVGQFAIALLLEICHHIGHHDQKVHEGRWMESGDFCFWDYPLIELYGKTIGVIGFGRIGRATARIAHALGMKVLAYDRYPSDQPEDYPFKYVDLETLFHESDVISLHCPLFDDNKEMINQKSIQKMKDGVIILNNSRGPLICEEDLADALNTGKVYAAGLDVVSTEPITDENPLLNAKNCFLTPHISWASKESRERLMNLAADNLKAFLDGDPINVVSQPI